MTRTISEGRKFAYYGGALLMVAGILVFASTFFTGVGSFGLAENASRPAATALTGMALIAVGALIRAVGARGLAGSGLVLDPEQGRSDLEPYSRMAGGMVKDALDEADVDLSRTAQKVVMLKCAACGQLSGETASFCQACGRKL